MDAIFSVKREGQSFLFCKEYENDESKMDMTVGGAENTLVRRDVRRLDFVSIVTGHVSTLAHAC